MVNYNVEDSGWRRVVQRPEEEENKGRGMEKVTSSVGTNSHHFVLVCVHAHTHTHLSVSDSLSCRPFHLLFLLQMWEMKRIGGVIFKCGNALAKSATSINTSTCIQYTCMHPHKVNIMLYCCWNSGVE